MDDGIRNQRLLARLISGQERITGRVEEVAQSGGHLHLRVRAAVVDEIESRQQLAPGAVPLVHVHAVLLGVVPQAFKEPVYRIVT